VQKFKNSDDDDDDDDDNDDDWLEPKVSFVVSSPNLSRNKY